MMTVQDLISHLGKCDQEKLVKVQFGEDEPWVCSGVVEDAEKEVVWLALS